METDRHPVSESKGPDEAEQLLSAAEGRLDQGGLDVPLKRHLQA